ncbi:hypothetical protein [Gemmiger formicilis]|uniref:hypothetical protein n=1 Tax=Gemmiger formicilis TaxID=745368 RepID=UPI00117A2DD8|nr:hypothetical protein [Gemmiger formicilis]
MIGWREEVLRVWVAGVFGGGGLGVAASSFADVAGVVGPLPPILGHFALLMVIGLGGVFFYEIELCSPAGSRFFLVVGCGICCVVEVPPSAACRGFLPVFFWSASILVVWLVVSGCVVVVFCL